MCVCFPRWQQPYQPNQNVNWTFGTTPIKACRESTYQFSNWITRSNTCDPLYYNQFYKNSSATDLNYVTQWLVSASLCFLIGVRSSLAGRP